MSDVEENIERLISRSLDGMLDDRQQLELDRELIRNPEARRMMEEYRGADALAAAALADLGRAGVDVDRIVAKATRRKAEVPRRHRSRRGWLLVPGAIAAAVLAMVVPKPLFDGGDDLHAPTFSVDAESSTHRQLGRPPLPVPMGSNAAPMRTVGDRSMLRRRAGTEWIGVVGDDGNVYWIEVQRTRTIRIAGHNRRMGGSFLER